MEEGENLRKKIGKNIFFANIGSESVASDFFLLRYYALLRIGFKNFDKGGRGFRGENKIHGRKKFMIFSPETKNQKGHKKYIL